MLFDVLTLKDGFHNFARPAKLHFFFPSFVNITVTNCTADKPAKIAGLELPCRTHFFLLSRTRFYIPAGHSVADIIL